MSSAAMSSPIRRRTARRLPPLGARVAGVLVDVSGLVVLLGLWAVGGWLIARNPA
ncbi:MAG: ABC transporter permease, partial [Alphaproteobacteria bacterium]|nr:ABC transporter permease [Alphaproteobacteria bacterium]